MPPDFLVDGYLAVEVRRLNQNFDFGTRTKGLEQTSIWWLVLVDHIHFGIDDYGRAQVRKNVREIGNWDKVIVINAESSNLVLEL